MSLFILSDLPFKATGFSVCFCRKRDRTSACGGFVSFFYAKACMACRDHAPLPRFPLRESGRNITMKSRIRGLSMKKKLLQAIKKNLFGIITAVLSAGILLAFLFSSDVLGSLDRISQNMQYHWLLSAVAAAALAWVLEGAVLNIFCRAVYREWKFHYSFCADIRKSAMRKSIGSWLSFMKALPFLENPGGYISAPSYSPSYK